jgi:hypothetical protein
MTYRSRNILFVFFVVVFLLLTTYFSLYVSGYRISFINLLSGDPLIQKTGMLVVGSSPRGADISLSRQFRGLFLDTDVLKDQNLRTSQKVKNLLPGEYILTLERENYWPWQEKIRIFPGQATYIEDIVLFRRSLPMFFLDSSVQNISLSSSGQKIILKEENRLIDLSLDEEIEIERDFDDIDFLDDRRVLLDSSSFLDLRTREYIDFSEKEEDLRKVKLFANNIFYLNDSLSSYNLSSAREETVFSLDGIVDYDRYDNKYFLIVEEDNHFSLDIYSYRGKSLLRSVELPSFGDYRILSPPRASNFVYVYDKKFKKIYVINTASKTGSYWSVIDNVKGLEFVDANNFYYFSDFEIYMFNSVLAESFLITRLSSEIKGLVWHPDDCVIFSDGKNIVLLDLKYENHSINLISLEKISNLALDRREHLLYFTGQTGNQKGLYRLFIK